MSGSREAGQLRDGHVLVFLTLCLLNQAFAEG